MGSRLYKGGCNKNYKYCACDSNKAMFRMHLQACFTVHPLVPKSSQFTIRGNSPEFVEVKIFVSESRCA